MAMPYVGEIRMFAGNFAPAGWELCDGRLLPIAENDVLFALIGTTYGGDGESTFALPDLRGRVPVHSGGGMVIGQRGGVEEVTLTAAQTPTHTHALTASADNATQSAASGHVLAQASGFTPYIDEAPNIGLHPGAVTSAGGGQAHNNLAPYLCLNFIVSLFGIFPSQT